MTILTHITTNKSTNISVFQQKNNTQSIFSNALTNEVLTDRLRTIDDIFNELYTDWYEEVKYISSPRMYDNRHYQNIISLGIYVLPCIMSKLKTAPEHLFEALTQITGEDPVPKTHWGDTEQMTEDWFTWWKNRPHA